MILNSLHLSPTNFICKKLLSVLFGMVKPLILFQIGFGTWATINPIYIVMINSKHEMCAI